MRLRQPRLRAVAAIGGVVIALGGITSCGGGASDASSMQDATTLPDDLCSTVPDEFVSAYALGAAEDEGSPGEDEASAICTMTGTAGGQPVTFSLEVTSYGESGDQNPVERATAAVEDRCRDLRNGSLRDVEVETNRCSATSGPDSETPGGHVIDISRLPSEGALLAIDVDAPGQPTSRVRFDVTGLATEYLSDGLLS